MRRALYAAIFRNPNDTEHPVRVLTFEGESEQLACDHAQHVLRGLPEGTTLDVVRRIGALKGSEHWKDL